MRDFEGVELSNRTASKSCPATAKEALTSDAVFYKSQSESQQVTFRKSDSQNPLSPYNYTVVPKKTRLHRCVCDGKNKPIDHR